MQFSLKLAAIIFLVATVLFGALCFSWVTATQNGELGHGLNLKATELLGIPQHYFNLTDPDRYTLEAINSPGKWVYVENTTEETFTEKYLEFGTYNFTYNGRFYNMEMIQAELLSHIFGPSEISLGSGVLGATWLGLGVAVIRNRKKH